MDDNERKLMIAMMQKHGAVTVKPTCCKVREAVESIERVIGREVKKVETQDAEDCEFRICSLFRTCKEDEESPCCECGKTLYHAPGGPFKPKKICIHCVIAVDRGEKSMGV